jgi:hypothetical protein
MGNVAQFTTPLHAGPEAGFGPELNWMVFDPLRMR